MAKVRYSARFAQEDWRRESEVLAPRLSPGDLRTRSAAGAKHEVSAFHPAASADVRFFFFSDVAAQAARFMSGIELSPWELVAFSAFLLFFLQKLHSSFWQEDI